MRLLSMTTLLIAALPLVVRAQEVSGMRAEPLPGRIGQPVEIILDINKHDRESFICGVNLALGDGVTRNLRITEKDIPLRISHKYATAGSFVVTAEGKFIPRGLKSATPCDVTAKPIAIFVQAEAVAQSVAGSQTNSGRQQPASSSSVQASPLPTSIPTASSTQPATVRQIVRDAIAAFAADNEIGKAKAAYERALQLQPGYLPALVGLAMMLEAEGDSIKAKQVFLEITQKTKPGALADFATREIAVLDARIKASATPEDRKNLDYKELIDSARMYLSLGQAQVAAERARAARALDDTRWEAYAISGQIAISLNLKSDARRLYQAARKRTNEAHLRGTLIKAAAATLGKDALCEGCDVTKAELIQYATSVFDEALYEIENGYGSGYTKGMPFTTAGIGHRLERDSYKSHAGFSKTLKIYSYQDTADKYLKELQRKSLEVIKPLFQKFKGALLRKGYRVYINGSTPYVYFESSGPKGMPTVTSSAGTDSGPVFINIFWYDQEAAGADWKQIIGEAYHRTF